MLIDRLLDYVAYDTTSDGESETSPSSKKQLELGRHLYAELLKLGLKDVIMDEYGYVYGYLPGLGNKPTIGLLAHMDTSEAASGANCQPRIIENYDGKDIILNEELATTVERFPFLKELVGKTLVVTDGKTLLGADDKAGIAIIMEVLETLILDQSIEHGPIRVAFTPDEEVGRGTEKFNYDLFKVDFAYTLDGDDPNNIEYENFNAATAIVDLIGISVHPGSAKNKMVNANQLAFEFHGLLDPEMVPEKTEGYEGFNHLSGMKVDVASGKMGYIIRNHDLALLEKQKQMFLDSADIMNERYGYECVKVTLIDSYRNMKEKFADNMYPIDLVKEAMKELDMNFKAVAIRGGTDGANLTWNGVLCPNLGTGGRNFHGVHELWVVEEGQQAVKLVLEILKKAVK